MNLDELPKIDFATADPDEVLASTREVAESIVRRKISDADPLFLLVKVLSTIVIQQRLFIDQSAKQNLLAYAAGSYLDHLGILVGCERLFSTRATVTMQLNLSAERSTSTIIPAGTRFTAGDNIYFILDEDTIIDAGSISTEAKCTCSIYGHLGNNYNIGEINEIVDPQPYLASVSNINESAGGSDVESDDDYRERIRQAPEKFSNAGSRGAYEYFTKAASNLIADVCISSPSPGVVKVQPLLENGELPTSEILATVLETLNDRSVRPLTDLVIVEQPTIIRYNIEFTYSIGRNKATYASSIQNKVDQAVQDYIMWQKEKLGRDIEPLELCYRLRSIGVKRINLSSPSFVATNPDSVAICDAVNIIFSGIEDE